MQCGKRIKMEILPFVMDFGRFEKLIINAVKKNINFVTCLNKECELDFLIERNQKD